MKCDMFLQKSKVWYTFILTYTGWMFSLPRSIWLQDVLQNSQVQVCFLNIFVHKLTLQLKEEKYNKESNC